jgi:hypothetical protein
MTEEQFWNSSPKKLQALFRVYKVIHGIQDTDLDNTIDNILF